MVPPELRQQPHVSFSQLDQYLRCPLKFFPRSRFLGSRPRRQAHGDQQAHE